MNTTNNETLHGGAIRTISVTKRDGSVKSVESSYTDRAAMVQLRTIKRGMNGSASSFMASLAEKSVHEMSPKQIAWVHILVIEWFDRIAAAALAPALTVKLDQIRNMMDEAAESLQYPKISLTAEGGGCVKLVRAGSRAARPGTINVTDGKPFGSNIWYGKIGLDGMLDPSRNMTDAVMACLSAFDSDPSAVATAHGHNTGKCCFCNKALTDGRSVAMGYGPICAGKYNLTWGEERVSSSVKVYADEC